MTVRGNLRGRFWVAAALASLALILCVITPVWPDWIEAISGWDPDQHDGSVEWLIAAALLVVSVAMFAVARLEWRRAAIAQP